MDLLHAWVKKQDVKGMTSTRGAPAMIPSPGEERGEGMGGGG